MSSSNNQQVTSDAVSEYTLVDKDNASIFSKTDTITDANTNANKGKEKKSILDRLKSSKKSSSESSSSGPSSSVAERRKQIPKQDPIKSWEARVCASSLR